MLVALVALRLGPLLPGRPKGPRQLWRRRWLLLTAQLRLRRPRYCLLPGRRSAALALCLHMHGRRFLCSGRRFAHRGRLWPWRPPCLAPLSTSLCLPRLAAPDRRVLRLLLQAMMPALPCSCQVPRPWPPQGRLLLLATVWLRWLLMVGVSTLCRPRRLPSLQRLCLLLVTAPRLSLCGLLRLRRTLWLPW